MLYQIFLRCCVAVVALLCSAFYLELLLVAPSSGGTDRKLNAVDDLIDVSKYDIFSVTFADKTVHKYSGAKRSAAVPSVVFRDEDTIRDIVEKRSPAVITGSSASKWPALDWDIWELAKKFPLLLGAAVAEDPQSSTVLLQYELDRGGMLSDAAMLPPARLVHDLFFVNFLLAFKNAAVRMFYSSDFRIFQRMIRAENDAEWRDFVIVEYVAAHPNVPDDEEEMGKDVDISDASSGLNVSIPNLWLLHPGSALQARYSPYHTFKVQLKGSARYVLIPPLHVDKHAYLYPHIHVSHGQSQVNFEDPDFDVTPEFAKINTHEVNILSPGEVLYIPPFWMVRAETDVGAMGVDVLSPSQEQLIALEASLQLVPLHQYAESKEQRIIAAQVYLVHVLSRLPDDVVMTPRDFAEDLYRQRFAALYPKSGLFMRKSDFNCIMGGSPKIHSEMIENLNKLGIYDAADRTAACVNDPSLDATTRRLWAADYVETVARWAMQNPEEVVFFITECLNFESKIEIVEEVEGPSTLFFSGGKEE